MNFFGKCLLVVLLFALWCFFDVEKRHYKKIFGGYTIALIVGLVAYVLIGVFGIFR